MSDRAPFAMPALHVDHVITADDPFGEPWPPDGSCSIFRRTGHGFTVWRRISISQTHASASPPGGAWPPLGGK